MWDKELLANTESVNFQFPNLPNFFAGICFHATEPADTEVMRIVETAFIPRICDPVSKDLIGYGRWISAQIFSKC